jgi:hypothetical protein
VEGDRIMIKFLTENQRTKRIILGCVLTDGNLGYLLNGKPIHINAEDLTLPEFKFNELLILYYPNNEEALKDLKEKGYIQDDVKVETIGKGTIQ